MTTLANTLQVFADLLAAEQPVDAGQADQAVWAYLVPVQGLRAQEEALARLGEEVGTLDASSAFMPTLIDILDRHRARLAEGHG